MKLEELIQDFSFKGIKNYKNVQIDNLTNSTNQDLKDGLYFCLKGSKVDGHDFASQAVDKGAVCLVVERYLNLPVTQILVDNARKAMSSLSAKFYGFDKCNIKFIGVTGTNGKTTTAFITKHILQNLGKSVGMIGTEGIYFNNLKLPATLTTPDPIQLHKIISDMAQNGIEYVVMEVSAHALALNKVDSILYDVVGITNITQDHLDYFNSMENYARAKSLLFTYKHAQKAIINIDDKYTLSIYKHCDIDKMSLSLTRSADIEVEESDFETDKTKAVISIGEKQYIVNSSLVGEYNLANTLMAIGFCNSLGFEISDILQALNRTKVVVPGRLSIISTPKNNSVVIDYAHTPDGIEKVLSTLNKIKKGKMIVVFGCGGNRDSTKRGQMGEIASRLSDYVVITSDNPRDENPYQIIADINKGITKSNVANICDRTSAINYALDMAEEGDIIAILGKGNEATQEIKGQKFPYSDFKVVEDYFNNKKLNCLEF